jgi:hypothetical protein
VYAVVHHVHGAGDGRIVSVDSLDVSRPGCVALRVRLDSRTDTIVSCPDRSQPCTVEGGMEVRALFAVDHALTAGWIHYLAFDLFVGTWIARRAGELGLPHLAVVPLLALTFLFGPAGLLAFFVLRAVMRPASLKPAFNASSGTSR